MICIFTDSLQYRDVFAIHMQHFLHEKGQLTPTTDLVFGGRPPTPSSTAYVSLTHPVVWVEFRVWTFTRSMEHQFSGKLLEQSLGP